MANSDARKWLRSRGHQAIAEAEWLERTAYHDRDCAGNWWAMKTECGSAAAKVICKVHHSTVDAILRRGGEISCGTRIDGVGHSTDYLDF